ncbi:hypothetical protein [Ruegeria lacuscaerulensis]|uniref:hypothetical protein n=1 Tax=Ruegeria lacuscaerulensis TaxID=55218 RepID=UPI001480A1A7|nr:hypothetical protein [Ruegeria lacuscaerulensis]
MKHDVTIQNGKTLTDSFIKSAQRRVTIDIEKYQAYLGGSGMSAEQKEAFLQAMYSIVVAFVELGFGVHPPQQACGKPHEELDCAPQTDSNERRSKEEQEDTRESPHDPACGLEVK